MPQVRAYNTADQQQTFGLQTPSNPTAETMSFTTHCQQSMICGNTQPTCASDAARCLVLARQAVSGANMATVTMSSPAWKLSWEALLSRWKPV